MNNQSFRFTAGGSFLKITTICLVIFTLFVSSLAQYRGAPVKKERLVKALRSKQFPTQDIVTIIKSNGVDFDLTLEVRNALIAAGARPEVINAIEENSRFTGKDNFARSKKRKNDSSTVYDNLLEQALVVYKDENNPSGAARILESAIKKRPDEAAAYQMLGFVNLYGLKNLPQAEKYMLESIENGGSAVFRVYHDDKGSFTKRCTGSLYVSPESLRFESDDNIHTFETSMVNIDEIKLDRESSKIWKNHTIFKIYMQLGKTDAKFRFAPLTNNLEESKMVARFVQRSKGNVVSGGKKVPNKDIVITYR